MKNHHHKYRKTPVILLGLAMASIGLLSQLYGQSSNRSVSQSVSQTQIPNLVSRSQPPHLQKRGTATQLIVDGKPFLVLGGEVHNSSSANLDYLAPILAKFSAGHLNTALAAVCWDLIEPVEGRFDFSLVDGLISSARRNNLRLGLLWFGSWKNGVSTYSPSWVKTDLKRFPRARNKEGLSLDILSTFSDANRDADARAFAALMHHVCTIDGDAHTVVMIQVENEVGVLSESRDHSPVADEAFKGAVPKELMDYLKKHKDNLSPGFLKEWEAGGFKTSGSWEEIFGAGDATNEMFMAWYYARYVGKVAGAGKSEYAIPMFVNTWLADWRPSAPMKPGDYPSGGPLPYVMDIWKAGAPQIDILSPDIYSFFEERAALYRRPDNPLFIPELVRETRTCSAIFYGLGQYDAIGFSPFGMESLPDFSAELGKTYEVLGKIAPVLLEYQGKNVIGGAFLDKDHPKQSLRVGDYTLNLGIARHYSFPTPEFPAGIFIQLGPDEYLVAGRGLTVTFTPETPGDPTVGIVSVEDGDFLNGGWVPGRRLNGDEILSGKGLRLRGDYYMIQRIKLYRYR
ncbi:GH35 family beta-galactosidase [Flavitalea flava]